MSAIQHIWEKYLGEGGKEDYTAFGVYLIRHADTLKGQGHKAGLPAAMNNRQIKVADGVSTKAAILTGRLERFVFLQAKPRLKAAGMDNPDDFGLLAALYFKPYISKGQLIKQALIEPATGTEMIKRMKRAGWVLEKPNPEDGRSVLVTLSAKGKRLMENCFAQLGAVDDILEVLSPEEKDLLVGMLEKLDACHSEKAGIHAIATWMQQEYMHVFG